jgi:hypothetical protein
LTSANFVGTVYQGLPLGLHKPSGKPAGGYLAFLGRISPKRPDRAIAIARAAGLPLKIAAKIDKVDEVYFRQVIAPLLDGQKLSLLVRLTKAPRPSFSVERPDCCFRSIGPNPSDWS